MGYKTEEKIINGIKTTFNYKSSSFGIKKILSNKKEYFDDKIISTHYFDTGEISGYYEENLNHESHGIIKEYAHHYPEGKDFKKEDIVYYLKIVSNYKNGELHGESKTFSVKGHPVLIEHFNLGNEVGKQQKYCFNCGNLLFDGTFSDGIPVGTHKHYDCDGNSTIDIIYKDGKNNYNEIQYHDKSKKIKSYESFVDGLKHGICKYYTEYGVIKEEGEYQKGNKVGNWIINKDYSENDNEI